MSISKDSNPVAHNLWVASNTDTSPSGILKVVYMPHEHILGVPHYIFTG